MKILHKLLSLIHTFSPLRHSFSEVSPAQDKSFGPLRHSFSEASPLRHSFSEASPLRHSFSEASPAQDKSKPQKWVFIFEGGFALLIFVVAAVYISYPLIFHMADYVNGEFVIAWIMNWNIHALTHFTWPFFDANIFYPYHNTLAYSDLLLSSSILALPFFLFTHEPMVPSNITFLSSLIFLGFFTYILVYYLTKNFFASLLSGLLIIFSPVVLDKRYHLQILAIEWIPLALVFFLHFIKKVQYRYLSLSLLCFIIQTYNSFMAGYFLLFSYAGIVLAFFLFDRKVISAIFTKRTVILFLFSLLLIFPIIIPYFQVSRQFHFVRDIRETIHLGLQPEDLLVTNSYSRMQPLLWAFDSSRYLTTAEIKPGFLGLVFSLLVIFSLFFILRKKKNTLSAAFLVIALFGLILSFGPALHLGRHTIHKPFIIPLPYALMYYVLPGFKGIRDSSRFEMLFLLSMAVVVGIIMHEVLQKRKRVIKLFIYILLILGIVGEFKSIHFEKAYTLKQFPSVYSWIEKNTPANAVFAEMPIYNWDNNPFGDNREVLREYFSTLHFRKLISGGSGFSPPPWQDFAKEEFIDFPSPESIAKVQYYGATYLVVHADEFDELHNRSYKAGSHIVYTSSYVLSALSQNTHVRFIIKEGDAYVYQFK